MKALVACSDDAVAEIVDKALGPGCSRARARTADEAWRLFESAPPDLILIDLGEEGLAFCRRIRGHQARGLTPVIFATSEKALEHKVEAFAAGADHVLVNPFPAAELKLWTQALLRRARYREEEGGVLRAGDFAMDPRNRTVRAGDAVIRDLTAKEFELLYELVRLRPKPLSRSYILSNLWGKVLRDNTVEVHIRNIRKKLGPASKRVATVTGSGYRFE
jgi:DNA-binding response OmpR family regulator